MRMTFRHRLLALSALPLFALALTAAPLSAAEAPDPSTEYQSVTVQLDAGSAIGLWQGTLAGYGHVDYLVPSKAGQTLSVEVEVGDPSIEFSVHAPGAKAALPNAHRIKTYSGKISEDGNYKVRVTLAPGAVATGDTMIFGIRIRQTAPE